MFCSKFVLVYKTKFIKCLPNIICAFCIYELAGHCSPIEVTADFVYIRLHGPGNKYQGNYEEKVLKHWADKLIGWRDKGKDVYVYFDNDQDAFAAFNALTLKDLVIGQ